MKQNLLLFTGSLLLLGLFFSLTNPRELAVGLLIIPVACLFVVGFIGALIALKAFRIAQNHHKRRRAIAVMCGALLAFILVLQSTGGIVVGDVLFMALMLLVTYIYITKF